MEALGPILNIVKVALGLGFVIFLHELGHFLLAKWNNVKVEKFSIGFGPTLLGFTRGETEYVIAAFPLGGFVKMLGEGEPGEAAKSTDPRAYPNKSVGARMAIISAGVIMNLILGLACFVYAYGQGMEELSTSIGAVVAGSPAYRAGVLPGDEIVEMDGRTNLSFTNVTLRIRLSSEGQRIQFKLKRPGEQGLIPLEIEPVRDANANYPGIGIVPSLSLVLGLHPYLAPAGIVEKPTTPNAGLKAEDRVIAAGPVGQEPTPVTDVQEFYRISDKYRGEPLQVVVERPQKGADGKVSGTQEARTTIPPVHFVDFGFRLDMEPIVAIRPGSRAEQAGFRVGDRIVKVDDREDFDPVRLPTLCRERADQSMTFEVERSEGGGTPQRLTISVTPDDTPAWTEPPIPFEPLDVPGLGFAYKIRTRIRSVLPDSPAARAGLKPGDIINALTLPGFKLAGEEQRPFDITWEEDDNRWPFAFQLMQLQPRDKILLQVNNGNTRVAIMPEPDPTWFHPLRGERFRSLTRHSPPLDLTMAMQRGFDETVDNILSIYATFRSLFQGRVSPKNLGGPIMIAQAAYDSAGMGWTELIKFLGMLSINLAVLNFLPIPPLDGGQMVFLIAEKIRGRPLPDSALNVVLYLGVLFVIGLMVFVTYQDVWRVVSNKP